MPLARGTLLCQSAAMWGVMKLVMVAALGWALLVGLIALMQERMLFPRLPQSAITLPPEAEPLSLTTPEGDRLQGHRLPGNGAAGERALILGFGGNGWDARATLLYLHAAFPGHDVAAFHFRGYAPSEGRPSAAALMQDAVLIHDALTNAHDGPVIAVGISLGSGAAAHLAGARPLGGVILMTAFDDLTEVARQSFPWAPVRLLFHHAMPAADSLAISTAPVALITASEDRAITAARTAALRARLPPGRLVLDVTLTAGHDDIHTLPETRAALRRALDALLDHRP